MPLDLLETQIIVKLTEVDNLVKVAVVGKVETAVELVVVVAAVKVVVMGVAAVKVVVMVVAAVKVVVKGGTGETEDRVAVKVEMAVGLLPLERPTLQGEMERLSIKLLEPQGIKELL